MSTAHILANMSNSSSQLKRGKPLHDGGINGVDEERPQALNNFVKAKLKIIAIFANFIKCLECFINILKRFSDKNDIKEDLSEVRLSHVAICSFLFSPIIFPNLHKTWSRHQFCNLGNGHCDPISTYNPCLYSWCISLCTHSRYLYCHCQFF